MTSLYRNKTTFQKMNYRKLGKSNLKISEISFGCMSLEPDANQNKKLIHKALDQGINFFDTADLYEKGENEIRVGKALKENRKEIIIATKVGNQWREDGNGWDWNPKKEYILKAVDKSLRRLQTDYIDLYQLHGGTIEDPIDETIEAFEILQKQGKIRYYGISSIRPNVIRKWIEHSKIVSVMKQYSVLDRRPEEECLALLQKNKIGVLARGTLAKGLLAGKPADSYLDYTETEVESILETIQKEISPDSISDAAIRFVLQHPAITSAVVGFRTESQLSEILKALETDTDIASFSKNIPIKTYKKHR